MSGGAPARLDLRVGGRRETELVTAWSGGLPAMIADENADVTATFDAADVALVATIPTSARDNSHRFLELEQLRADESVTVHRVYDANLHREVVRKRVVGDEATLARLQTGASAMARLSHPNIAAVYDVRISTGELVLATELVPGRDLRTWQRDHRDRSWTTRLDILLQASAALRVAHAQGVVHGRLHAGNIRIRDDGRVQLTDFGMTRCPGEVRDDLSALCALGDELMASAFEPLAGLRPAPRSSRARRLLELLAQGLAPRPEDRFASSAELHAALETTRPRARQRELLAALGAVVMLGLGLPSWMFYSERSGQCTGADAVVADIWGEPKRAAVQQAVLATGLAYAPESWKLIATTIDGYVEQWRAHHIRACQASINREQSAEVLDLRMVCLRHAADDLRALVTIAMAADGNIVRNTARLLADLPNLEHCADIEALGRERPLPSDPQKARRVEQAQRLIARARMLDTAGKYREALENIDEAESQVEDIDYPPVTAVLTYRRGLARSRLGEAERGAALLGDALMRMLATGQNDLASRAAAQLAYALGHLQVRPGEVSALLSVGFAYADRPDLEAEIRNVEAVVLVTQGAYEQAVPKLEESLQLLEIAFGGDSFLAAEGHHNLAVALHHTGRFVAAQARYQRAIELMHRQLGARHPWVAGSLMGLGLTLLAQGRHADADNVLGDAWELCESVPDLSRVQCTKLLTFRAGVALARDDLDHAREYLQTAITRFEDLQHAALASEARSELAAVLIRERRMDEAREVLRLALGTLIRTWGSEHPNVANAYRRLGDIAWYQHDHVRARRHYERAWIRLRASSKHAMRAHAAWGLARTIAEQEPERSKRLARAAILAYDRAGERWWARQLEVDHWLEQEGPAR